MINHVNAHHEAKKLAENTLWEVLQLHRGSEPGQDTGVGVVQMQAAAEEKERSGPQTPSEARLGVERCRDLQASRPSSI